MVVHNMLCNVRGLTALFGMLDLDYPEEAVVKAP